MNDFEKTIFFVALIAATLIPFALVGTAHATHDRGVVDFEWHKWSRSSTDGHSGLLNCDSNNDYCAIKVKVTSGVQSLSKSTIISKVDAAETVIDNLGKKMSVDRVTSGTINQLKQGNLSNDKNGKTVYELHCTNKGWFGCNSKDMHFTKMTVLLNDNASEINIQDYEDRRSNPKVNDVDKILRHELFHAMGIDHNSGKSSIVFYQYVFGTNGLTPSATDISDLGSRYP